MSLRDNRVALTPDDRDTLRKVFDFVLDECDNSLRYSITRTQKFGVTLAQSKVRALRDKIFPASPIGKL